MIIEPLETWLLKYTDVGFPIYINFNIAPYYLKYNKFPNSYYYLYDEDFKKLEEYFLGLDDEGIIIFTEEQLIHPVILSQHLKQTIINMEKELTKLTMQRLKDSEKALKKVTI